MSRKLKGFSLAELLISLLVISIVLSAAIPTLTRQSKQLEQIWNWAGKNSNNSAYFGVGSLQSAIIGNDVIPELKNEELWTDPYAKNASFEKVRYTNKGDRLILFKQSTATNEGSHLMNSHISFYNMENNATTKTNSVGYAGRLVLEKHNIALGIGSLQSLNNTSSEFPGNNTALGHYTLFNNIGGAFNTAIGELALAHNKYAKHNTALGYRAGMYLDGNSAQYNDKVNALNNTAIGSMALGASVEGQSNTAVGYNALIANSGSFNTAVGVQAIGKFETPEDKFEPIVGSGGSGFGNTAIGYNSCYYVNGDKKSPGTVGNNNICIGMNAGDSINDILMKGYDYNLFIGSFGNGDVSGDKKSYTPLITGRMQHNGDEEPREIRFNTEKTELRTYEGSQTMLLYESLADKDTGTLNMITKKNKTGLRISGDDNVINMDAINDASSSTSPVREFLTISSNGKGIDLFGNRLLIVDDKNLNTNKRTSRIEILKNFVSLSAASASARLDSNTPDIRILLDAQSGDKAIILEAPNVFIRNAQKLQFNKSDADIIIPGLTKGGSLKNDLKELWNAVGGTSSDERLKDISGDNKSGLKEINALEVKNYTYKDDKEKTPHVGVIAQQLQKVFPNSVFKGEDGYLRIKTEEIFYAMVNSIKELCIQIQDLTAKITGLDERINALEKENAQLKKQNSDFEKRLSKLEKQISK